MLYYIVHQMLIEISCVYFIVPLVCVPRTGALRARLVRLVQPAKVETVQVNCCVDLVGVPHAQKPSVYHSYC